MWNGGAENALEVHLHLKCKPKDTKHDVQFLLQTYQPDMPLLLGTCGRNEVGKKSESFLFIYLFFPAGWE